MAQFKIGDKVQLKSGGPVMTVEDIYNENEHELNLEDDSNFTILPLDANGTVYVAYYCEKTKKMVHDKFLPDTLNLVDE